MAVLLVAGTGCVVVTLVGSAGPAAASCAYPPRVSAHPFTGTVTEARDGGRTATVRTDDGRTVVVRGGQADNPNAMTSVDRTYEVGARYEFHPLNDSDPYQDNACTSTHRIAAASPASSGPAVVELRLVTTSSSWTLYAGGFVLLVLGAGVAWRLRRRTRRE
jgi:MYXO-CTERM domain-containing protein